MPSANEVLHGVYAILYWEDFASRREALAAINRIVLPPSYIYEEAASYRCEWLVTPGDPSDAFLHALKRILNARKTQYFTFAKRISAHPEYVYSLSDIYAASHMNAETIDRVLNPDLLWDRAYESRHERYRSVHEELTRRGMSFQAMKIMWDSHPIGDRRTKLAELAPFLEAVLEESARGLEAGEHLPWAPVLDGQEFFFSIKEAYAWWGKGISLVQTWDLLLDARFLRGKRSRNRRLAWKVRIDLGKAAEDGIRIPGAFSGGLQVHETPTKLRSGQGG